MTEMGILGVPKHRTDEERELEVWPQRLRRGGDVLMYGDSSRDGRVSGEVE